MNSKENPFDKPIKKAVKTKFEIPLEQIKANEKKDIIPSSVKERMEAINKYVTEGNLRDSVKLCQVCGSKIFASKIEWISSFFKISADALKDTIGKPREFDNDVLIWDYCRQCEIDRRYKEKSKDYRKNMLAKMKYKFGIYKDANFESHKNGCQKRLFNMVKNYEKPQSFYLYGRPAVGKTYSMYAILSYYIDQDLIFSFNNFTCNKLIKEFVKYGLERDYKAFTHLKIWEITVPPTESYYYILIDDFDKVKFTEFNLKEMLAVFDAIYKRGERFQFIITSNKSIYDLQKMIYDINNSWSDVLTSMFRRISEKCNDSKNFIELK